jgi:hypothetical protein
VAQRGVFIATRGLLHRRDRRQDPGGDNSAREQTRFEISVSPCTGRPRRGRPQPIAISREDQSLIRDPSQSFRDLPSATPGRPFRKSGTEGSNPLSSSVESSANLTFSLGLRHHACFGPARENSPASGNMCRAFISPSPPWWPIAKAGTNSGGSMPEKGRPVFLALRPSCTRCGL